MDVKGQFRHFVKSLLPRWLMIHKLNRSSTEILLTFDDGPDPVITPMVLEILHAKQKMAIFFVVGEKAEQYPEIVKRIVNEGHLLGNHTYSHPHNQKISISAYKSDIEKCQLVIERILGEKPAIFRPPCGEFNLKTVCSAKLLGLKIILMTNGGGEWNENKEAEPQKIKERILKNIEGGQIIVMHDNNAKIPVILASLIDNIEAMGLQMANRVTIADL